jgi:hypothetical protein
MKKIVASVGLVALGASGIQTLSAQSLGTPDTSKPWSIAATLRGFYDDNTATIPNGTVLPAGMHKSSFGFEVSPSAALAWSMQQTTINLGVLYSLKYYDNTPPFSADHADQDFTFTAGLTHAFSDQLKLSVSDSFVIGQEPDLLRAGNTFSTFQRVSGDNIRNYGSIGLNAQLTPKFGLGAGYDNSFYDYKDTGVGLSGPFVQPSIAGALNRIENRAHLEGTFQLMPETKGLIGYQFTDVEFTGDQPISGFSPNPETYAFSKTRNYREHTAYVGAEHNFLPNLTGSIRVGASYSDYYNDPNTSASYTPYVNASLRYSYAPQSYVEAGFSYDRNATDVVGLMGSGNGQAQVTVDAESAVAYLTINHHIAGNLFGSLMGQFQNSTYNGGEYNKQDEQYYLLGLDLEYRFNQYFSAHAGYNYDRLESPFRPFDRNRVYIGVTASY